eukprot:CAMPEP_0170486224 /NCGR_PEP_ID=MMETSP0208-20121228/5288_1 /TAXON_ID=197538 /ORGANISM="Strombidium inclinatum, Strain S3" /LENGTH=114 /DNA_ID=CAMNT_0010760093 /DNA_START=964 /DNA_END=1308 /DNA_ORIENTATION=-
MSSDYSGGVLLNLINDLLDLAKANNNAFSINNDFFDLKETMMEAQWTIQYLAEKKNIEMELWVDEKCQAFRVFADSGRLKQVIVNLTSNALKFTDEGGKVETRVSEGAPCEPKA